METHALDDLLDRLVAEFADRLAAGEPPEIEGFLARVPEENRGALGRCLRMVQAGIASAPRSAAALMPGRILDGFRIERELGRGGMAVVYLAEQLDLRRRVALKVLRPGLAIEPRHVDRFKREATTIARLQHPHIVQVHAVGEAEGWHYLAMELVDGTSLAAVIERLPKGREWTARDLAEASGVAALADAESYEQALCRLLAPAVRAVGLIHDLGLVHRDIKPSNLLIHPDGRVLVADFGLAKGEGDPGLSLSGEPLGTPYYMSPEQAALTANPVDQRSDVFSLGVTLFEALSGRRPFEGETVFAVLEAIRSRPAPALRSLARTRTRDAEAVVRKAIEHEPVRRYASALELATELGALAEGRPTLALAEEGGFWRRIARVRRQIAQGQVSEYRSARTFLGLPLVHVCFRRLPGQRRRVAKGWLAIGDVAIGGFAFGGVALGLVSFGGVAFGLLVCFAGIAAGGLPIGGVAVGFLAQGGFALGYGAVGGYAVGHYAMGGKVVGEFVAGPSVQHPEAIAFFEAWWWWLQLMPGMDAARRAVSRGS